MTTPPRWYAQDIHYYAYHTGYRIVLTTDVPCHLWMRWTLHEPWTHSDPRPIRGLYLPGKTRFCFVVFEDNEQEETGDTLTHTFIKKGWDVCETRYFYFHGEVGGVASPSVTPIFSRHRTEVFAVHKEIYYPTYDTCWYNENDPNWSTCRNADPPGGYCYTSRLYIASYVDGSGNYEIRRARYTFDTRAIPADSTILLARLNIYLHTLTGSGGRALRFTRDTQLTNLNSPHDYRYLLDYHQTIADSVRLVDWTGAGLYTREIYEADLDIIKPQDYTIIGLRLNLDHENITPQNGIQEGQFEASGQQEPTLRTYLEVWYVA